MAFFAFFLSHLIDALSPSISVCSNRCDYLPSNSGASAATANCNTWTCQLWYRCGDGCQGHRDTAVLPMQDDLVLQRQQKAATRTSSVDSLANHQEQLVICSYLLTPWYNFFLLFLVLSRCCLTGLFPVILSDFILLIFCCYWYLFFQFFSISLFVSSDRQFQISLFLTLRQWSYWVLR